MAKRRRKSFSKRKLRKVKSLRPNKIFRTRYKRLLT